MQTFDFVVIGAGPAGEGAAHKARELGASVAVVDRRWFGGSCPHIGCVPSKALLHAAERHASGSDYSWRRASERRDYMVNRPAGAAEPDDSSHVRSLERAGAATFRGTGRITDRGRVSVTGDDGSVTELAARDVIVAVGSTSKVPPIDGLADTHPWTNEQATLTRELPRSLLVLGGGPTGCELAQVFVRFGVPTTIVQSGSRLVPTEHPRNAETVRFALERDGAVVRTGARATRARAGAGTDGAHVIDLDDGTSAEGHAILLAVGRDFPVHDLGMEAYGIEVSGPDAYKRDGRLRVADGLWVAGDPAGPELHTHQGHYQGELAVRMALGESIVPDYRALPRATYMDPESASVGVTLDQALEAGLDAFECVADFTKSAKGYSVEAETGHVTIVVDRATRELVGRRDGVPGRVGRDPRVRARDQGARDGRRARRDDPRVPEHVAHPQRPVRRGTLQAGPADRLALGDDLAVDQHQARTGVPQRPTDLDRLPDGGRREHHDVGAAAGRQPSPVRLARADRRVDACGPDRAPQRHRVPRAEGRRPGAPRRRRACHGARDPRPWIGRLDRGVGPERDDRAAGVERADRERTGVRAIAPQPASLVDVGAQVDRLHRRGDAQRREPADVGRIDELRVLHARHQGRRPDGRGERVEGRPHRGIADPVDLRRDPQRRGPRRDVAQPPGLRDPDAMTIVGRPLARRGLHRLEEGGRARSERPVRERLEPPEAEPVERVRAERAAAAEPRLPRRLELLGADAGVDPQREVAGRGEPPVGVERTAEATADGQAARVVDGDDAQREQLARVARAAPP